MLDNVQSPPVIVAKFFIRHRKAGVEQSDRRLAPVPSTLSFAEHFHFFPPMVGDEFSTRIPVSKCKEKKNTIFQTYTMRALDISHGYRKYTLHFLNRITYAIVDSTTTFAFPSIFFCSPSDSGFCCSSRRPSAYSDFSFSPLSSHLYLHYRRFRSCSTS